MYGRYEEFGLEEVSEVSFEDDMCSWDVLGVWWHPETESYRVARDGGCSCNSPWEGFYHLDAYGDPLSYSEAWSYIEALAEDYWRDVTVEKAEAITALRDFEAKRGIAV